MDKPDTGIWPLEEWKNAVKNCHFEKAQKNIERIQAANISHKISYDTLDNIWKNQIFMIKQKKKRKFEVQRLIQERRIKGVEELRKQHERRIQHNVSNADRQREIEREREREERKRARQTIDLDEQNIVMSGLDELE